MSHELSPGKNEPSRAGQLVRLNEIAKGRDEDTKFAWGNATNYALLGGVGGWYSIAAPMEGANTACQK